MICGTYSGVVGIIEKFEEDKVTLGIFLSIWHCNNIQTNVACIDPDEGRVTTGEMIQKEEKEANQDSELESMSETLITRVPNTHMIDIVEAFE